MRPWGESHHVRLLCGAAVVSLMAASAPANAQQDSIDFNIPPQSLQAALDDFAAQSRHAILSSPDLTHAKMTPGVSGAIDTGAALGRLLEGTGLSYRLVGETYLIVRQEGGAGPQDPGAAGDVDALIVTAQKREERLQDVPIAISAFSQKALEEQKIEGGFDLLKAIPNVTFSKSNFTSYNFSIRGVGTKAISATTDPGVAVAFNNTSLIQNRLFEQEYFDVERVEVLRGPQGTLYGRNATSGVINVISAKPDLGDFEASAKVEVGSYDTRRLVGMLNMPLVEDVLAVRLAGAMTKRTGYDYNEITRNNVNGRDLWSGRVTVGFEPTPRLRANLLWEHFEEDDDRSRTSKQLCKRDPGPETIGGIAVGEARFTPQFREVQRALFSQGCLPTSLYDDAAFGTPNGIAMPFVYITLALGSYAGPGFTAPNAIGVDSQGRAVSILKQADPYGGLMQSRDLRTIASVRDPQYRAKADVFDLTVDFDVTDDLTLTSQTVYNEDQVYSFQDYNRFNSFPAFTDTSQIGPQSDRNYRQLAPGGIFCDPQIGCSDRLSGFDISQAEGTQFSQELRLQSGYEGPINFSFGANYTKFETEVDYYVMYNILTAMALTPPFNKHNSLDGAVDPDRCPFSGDYYPFLSAGDGPVATTDPSSVCIYIDPNPVESINGEGHNYFRSRNPYELESKAAFGELYWNVADELKLTAGLRYTKDRKTFTPVPSQVLLAPGPLAGGTVSRGYPEDAPIVQEWGEWTGRLGVDWKPVVGFTDETMLYAFYSRGYKGGGANPPSPGYATGQETADFWLGHGGADIFLFVPQPGPDGVRPPVLRLNAVEYGQTFEPEFVDALEIGAKNTLLGGAMTLNTTAFYYDYKDYQVSQIRDRTAVNENFDAKIWGLEFEAVYAPSRDVRINANLGYLDTRIAGGESSIDIMNRTQGDSRYTLVKPWVQLPSNCVVPTGVVVDFLQRRGLNEAGYQLVCGGTAGFFGAGLPINDPATGQPYDHTLYPELNGGAGLRAELGGNELPNAPHWTTNIGAQYGWNMGGGAWRGTLRTDAYWQSQSWARVYNAVNDKLHGWYNFNVAVTLENRERGVQAEFYVKNLLDKSPITDAFLNSDDTALTTNVFVLDPRLVGFSFRKTF